MTEVFLILLIPVLALVVGYIWGRNNIDPNTPQGRAYYASRKDTAK